LSTTRKRAIPFQGSARGILKSESKVIPWKIVSTGSMSDAFSPKALQGTQVTVSEYHPGWRKNISAKVDVGGNFFTQKKYAVADVSSETITGQQVTQTNPQTGEKTAWIDWMYHGPILPWHCQDAVFPPAANSSDMVLNAIGAKAIAIVKPTNSIADLATFLAELRREGIPKVIGAQSWKTKAAHGRSLGSEYLNVEFGWQPVVNEVRAIADSIRRADFAVRQYKRDAGRVVRRRYNFPPEYSETTTLFRSGVNAYASPSGFNMYKSSGTNQGTVFRTRSTSVRRWFSGAFTYHLPDYFPGMADNVAKAKRLLGAEVTPELLWNLAPWSWAVDWFSSTGDVISNLSDYATDGLVMRYGYLMEHSIVKDVYTFAGPTGLTDTSVRPSPVSLITETKIRRRANPFGFGLTMEALTGRQQAILVALGISKGKK